MKIQPEEIASCTVDLLALQSRCALLIVEGCLVDARNN
jgi:hypothetical protein